MSFDGRNSAIERRFFLKGSALVRVAALGVVPSRSW